MKNAWWIPCMMIAVTATAGCEKKPATTPVTTNQEVQNEEPASLKDREEQLKSFLAMRNKTVELLVKIKDEETAMMLKPMLMVNAKATAASKKMIKSWGPPSAEDEAPLAKYDNDIDRAHERVTKEVERLQKMPKVKEAIKEVFEEYEKMDEK